MKFTIALITLVSVTLLLVGMQDTPKADVSGFMRLKLRYAQGLLEGIVLEDYDLIEANAKKLELASQESTWMVLNTEQYIALSENFQAMAKQLGEEAEEKDLDAAALSHVQLTLNCVNCHKHVRKFRSKGEPKSK